MQLGCVWDSVESAQGDGARDAALSWDDERYERPCMVTE